MMERLIDVSNMVIEKALIAQDSGSQMLRTSVDVNWITKEAFCSFESYNVSPVSAPLVRLLMYPRKPAKGLRGMRPAQ